MNIKELHDEWFHYKGKRVKASTLATYESLYDLYVESYFAGHDMSNGVTNKEMNQFIEYLIRDKGLSLRTARDSKVVLGNILGYGATEHNFPLYPYRIEYPTTAKEQGRRIRFFSKEDCRKVFQKMEQDPDSRRLGLILGLTTGMRVGELVGLRFSDVDLQGKTISVNRTIQRIYLRPGISLDGLEIISEGENKSVVVANSPKTANSRRTCPLSALPLKWIRLYSKVNTPDRYIIGLGKKPIEPRTFRNWYYDELELLGLPLLNPHCMRHTFATQMLHNGVDPATTASILGHSSPAITLEIYSHTNEEEKQKQVNAVFGKMFRL